MKRIIKTTIVLMFMLIVLTGCTNTEYNVQINKNGSGKVECKIQLDESIIGDKIKELNMDTKSQMGLISAAEPLEPIIETAQESGYDVEEIKNEDVTVGCKLSKKFDNISDFKIQEAVGADSYVTITEDSGINIEKNLFITKITQNVTIDTTIGGDVINKVEISYKFPKGIVKSNADEKSGIIHSNRTWNLGNRESKKIEYTVYTLNLLPIIIILVVIILIVCLVIKKKKSGKEKIEKNKDNKLDKKSKSKTDKKADKKADKKVDKKNDKKNKNKTDKN